MDSNNYIGNGSRTNFTDIHTTVELVKKTSGHTDHDEDHKILFDFEVRYTTHCESADSESHGLGTTTSFPHHHTFRFEKKWLLGGDKDQLQARVYEILDMINVSDHREDIAWDLIEKFLDLKKLDAISVEKVKVEIHVVTVEYSDSDSDDDDDDDGDMDVNVNVDVPRAVPPASDEAIANHLVTVVVENDEKVCVICMEKIEPDVAAAKMPCDHVFHRTCGEDWLRQSGICPTCRKVFPS